jgi:putative ABC transport system permease protein
VKFLPLMWAMLWRSKLRTWLTFLSIVVAFVLFGLLQSVTGAFEAGVRLSADDQLFIGYRQQFAKLLPLSYRSRIERLDGIEMVDTVMFMGGWYQDPKNQLQILAVDPMLFGTLDPRVSMAPEQLAQFQNVRIGAVAGADLAKKFGWKVGDRLPVKSSPKKDGSQDWEFELVGLYELDDRRMGQHVVADNMFVRFDYYNETTPWPDHVVFFNAKIRDPKQAQAIGRAIDTEFRNAEFQTKTQTPAEFQRGILKQFGDVGVIMRSILGAVFFTLVLVAGNTMMQAFRERVPELAVLKTLGFTDGRVAALVVGESLLLCASAGAVGLGLAAFIVPRIRDAVGQFMAAMTLENVTIALAAVLALGLGAAAALVPAWRSARLSVIEALAVK